MADFNVLDFGAKFTSPDNTRAFQKAIDTVAKNGGGRVVVPSGKYNLDMISLKDNVELHLERGAYLKSIMKAVPEPGATCEEPTCNIYRFLIGGTGINCAAITGTGIIDGCGHENFWIIEPDREYPLFGQRYQPSNYRPKGLLHFRNSGNITISGVTILNSPAYTVWLLGCDKVTISSIKIDSPLSSPNTDGLDIDCCSNINIYDCDISTGDDAIALKSDTHTLGYDKVCENITVSNCRLKTSSCGIRVGYEGDGTIRNCIFSNCIIYNSMIGISLMSVIDPLNKRGIIIKRGPHIHDIIFSALVVNACQAFNFQHLKNTPGTLEGMIEHVVFRDIIASVQRGSYIGGLDERPIGHLEFNGISMVLTGNMGTDFIDDVPEPYPIWNDLMFSGIPWAIYARYLKSLTIRDSTFRWRDATGVWQGALHTHNISEVNVLNIDEFHE